MMPVFYDQIHVNDIQYILQHPWAVSAFEFELNKPGSLKETTESIQSKLELAGEDGLIACWKTTDALPISLLALFNVGIKQYETLFIASVHMASHGADITKALRELLNRKAATEYKGCSCRLYSASAHPKQIKWFEFIGFKYLPAFNIGNTRCFEYASVFD